MEAIRNARNLTELKTCINDHVVRIRDDPPPPVAIPDVGAFLTRIEEMEAELNSRMAEMDRRLKAEKLTRKAANGGRDDEEEEDHDQQRPLKKARTSSHPTSPEAGSKHKSKKPSTSGGTVHPLLPNMNPNLDDSVNEALRSANEGGLLTNNEILELIKAAKSGLLPISGAAPSKPPVNSVFIFDRNQTRFKQDGYKYNKERHATLVVDGKRRIKTYYGATVEDGIKRRSCWDLLKPDDWPDLAVVQYLHDVKGKKANTSAHVEDVEAPDDLGLVGTMPTQQKEHPPSTGKKKPKPAPKEELKEETKKDTIPLYAKEKFGAADRSNLFSMADALVVLSSTRVTTPDTMQLATKFMFKKIGQEEAVCLFNLICIFVLQDDVEMINSLVANALHEAERV